MAHLPAGEEFRLLATFAGLFRGKAYQHRASHLGDLVAMQLYEDMLALRRSAKFARRVSDGTHVVNTANLAHGIRARRGDGTFGEIVPGETPLHDQGYAVQRGRIATVEVGVEVKIMAKAMLKQINRVLTVLGDQVSHFRRGGADVLCLAIIGINHAPVATGYEGERGAFRTDGRKYKHPIQEAAEAERRILAETRGRYDEVLILRYRATNEAPFAFEWVDEIATRRDYGAILTRLSAEYERRH